MWFEIYDLGLLIVPNDILFNEAMQDCTVDYIDDILVIISIEDKDVKVIIKDYTELFKLNKSVEAKFHDGTGFAHESNAIIPDYKTLS